MTNERDDLIGTAIGGTFHVLRLLGEGGMARVYEAVNLPTGERVALKVLHHRHVNHSKVFARFQREARIVGSIEHDHIAGLAGTGTTATGLPYIVMELLDGQTLKQAISESAPLPVNRAAHIVTQVLSALQAAHDAHVVHRDLKPQNIYLTRDGHREDFVKLLDFGVSKLLPQEDETVSPLTDTGSVVGTANYMSPEQAVGAKNVSGRSDIYSIGVILYEVLTGTLPFDAANNNALMLKILIEDPPDPRGLNADIPVELAEIIRIAMDRSPARRFETCADFRARLLPFVSTSKHSDAKSASAPTAGQLNTETVPSANRQAGHVYDAIFVRLGTSSMEIALRDGNALKILPLEDENDLPEVLHEFFPRGVVSGAHIDVAALVNRFPTFRSPVILIDFRETHRELAIHEWSEEDKGYQVRRAPMTELDAEVNLFCTQREVVCFARADLKNIGFNDKVRCAGGTFHIATEVVSRDAVKISTKIWNGGRVLDDIVQVFRPIGGDVIAQAHELAQTQHAASVDEVLRGKYSPPE